MGLSSHTILQIDATVIAGLVILLTLQSVATPLWQKQADDFISNTRDLSIEISTIQDLMKEYCAPSTDSVGKLVLGNTPELHTRCNEWAIQSDELTKRVENWENTGKFIGTTTANNTALPSTSLKYAVTGNYQVNAIIILIIVIFGMSALFELISKINEPFDDDASRFGIILCIVGFVFLVGGFVAILGVMQCSNPFTVQKWCPQ